VIDLPPPSTADFFFRLRFHGPFDVAGEEREIAAFPVGVDSHGLSFWYWRFVPEAQSDEEVAHSFDATLLRLLRRPTRIRQRRGLLFWTFALEAQGASGEWKHEYTYGILRLALAATHGRVPPMHEREQV